MVFVKTIPKLPVFGAPMQHVLKCGNCIHGIADKNIYSALSVMPYFPPCELAQAIRAILQQSKARHGLSAGLAMVLVYIYAHTPATLSDPNRVD